MKDVFRWRSRRSTRLRPVVHLWLEVLMKKRVAVVRQVLLGLLVASVITFGSVEVVRGSGQTTNEPCSGCLISNDPDLWCEDCCAAEGSICLTGGVGQCLCA